MADTKVSALSAIAAVLATTEFPVNDAGTTKKATGQNIADFIGSMQFLGAAELGSAAASVTVTLPTGSWKNLLLYSRVAGYSGAGGIAGFQFNGDTGNNYADRQQISTSVTNTTGAARASIRIATAAITGPRGGIFAFVRKQATGLNAALCGLTNSDNEGGATAPVQYIFSGGWTNAAALFTSVSLIGNGVNLLTATRLMVYGSSQA